MRWMQNVAAGSILLTAVLAAQLASAQQGGADASDEAAPDPEPDPEPEPEPTVAKARALYQQGVKHVKSAAWQEALAAFERSYELRPHATTLHNIAACEQAMGRYAKARDTFRKTISRAAAHEGELAPTLKAEAEGYLQQIEERLVRVRVTLHPADAGVAVDGRPLVERTTAEGRHVFIAGIELPGPGVPAAGEFDLVLDPGPHVFTLSRKGFSDAVVQETYPPGAKETLTLEVERLPATLHVTSNVQDAIVTVNGMDVGSVPVDIRRPAGIYDVSVRKGGFETYEATIKANAGEEVNLRTTMAEEKESLTSKWWFWTGAAAVVVGGAALTYAVTRPEPDPPPYDGGSSGWVVRPQALF